MSKVPDFGELLKTELLEDMVEAQKRYGETWLTGIDLQRYKMRMAAYENVARSTLTGQEIDVSTGQPVNDNGKTLDANGWRK